MKAIDTFSLAPEATPSQWTDLADGHIYLATSGDYNTLRGFLNSMTRWASKNGFLVDRRVNHETGEVEFRLSKDEDF